MASVSSLGVGSGLDLNGLLSKLMAAEQQPLVQLAQREGATTAKISAFGSLSSAIANFSGAVTPLVLPSSSKNALEYFSVQKTSIADTEIASINAKTGATNAVYQLEVSNLAQAQRLVTPASAFSNLDSPVLSSGESGTLRIEIGKVNVGENGEKTFLPKTDSSAISIEITSENNTLSGVRDAINKADAGVTAAIITGQQGPQLVITSKSTGTENLIRLTDDAGNLGKLTYDPSTQTGGLTTASAQGGQDAANANIKINGIEAVSSTNTFTDAIDNVTINVAKTNVGAPTKLTIANESTLSNTLSGFVKGYNEIAKTLADLGRYDPQKTNNGPLLGSAQLRTVSSQLANQMLTIPPGISSSAAFKRLSDVGVSLQKDGSLKLDTAKLNAAIEKNPSAVADLAAAFGASMKKLVADNTGLPGIVKAASEGLNRTITDYGKMRTTLNKRLEGIQERYQKQFSSLDQLVATTNRTSSYLQQQLASLPGVSS